MSTSSRVIKNTTYLYIKMGITMFISLFSTRLILSSLGASDFGIFNVVGGAIAMLGFLNSTLANATQRFMSYAEGEGHLEKKRIVFNVSIVLHFIIALVSAFILLGFMYPLFSYVFNIEPDRIYAAKIIYICLIFSTLLTIVNVPYDAVMNAHENMLYYSIIGIFESLLKLVVAVICVYTAKDKLIIYGLLMASIPLITLSVMKVYCHRHYEECVIDPHRYWDRSIVMQIAGFSGWNLLTAISSLLSAQGLGIVLNHYYGTVLNAAQGIANQVNGVLSNFSANMRKALNPVITKFAGSGKQNSLNFATIAGCKFSTFLFLLFAIPLSLEINAVLEIWLKEVPNWTATFVILQIVISLLEQMASSAATAIYASGEIKYYAIWKSLTNVMPLFITWLMFSLGGGPIWLYIPMIIIWGLGGDVIIIKYAKDKCSLNVAEYIHNVVLPIIITIVFMFIFGSVPVMIFKEGIFRIILTFIASWGGMLLSAVFISLTNDEKRILLDSIKTIFTKIINRNVI